MNGSCEPFIALFGTIYFPTAPSFHILRKAFEMVRLFADFFYVIDDDFFKAFNLA